MESFTIFVKSIPTRGQNDYSTVFACDAVKVGDRPRIKGEVVCDAAMMMYVMQP